MTQQKQILLVPKQIVMSIASAIGALGMLVPLLAMASALPEQEPEQERILLRYLQLTEVLFVL
jgi:hypothetical protein